MEDKDKQLADMADTSSSPDQVLSSVDLLPIAQEQQGKVLSELVQAEDADSIKDLTHLFNATQTKRNALRIHALNDVQDSLVRQMADRLATQPNNFNNADIASWMKVVQQVMDTSQKNVDQVDAIPAITYQQNNNTQVNVSVADTLSRESRERITDAIQKILQNVQNAESEVVCESGELVEEPPVEVSETANTSDNSKSEGN